MRRNRCSGMLAECPRKPEPRSVDDVDWSLALVALALLGVAAVSKRLAGTPVTAAMVFVAFGLLAGPEVADAIDVSGTGSTVRALAEATLAVVLFADASRIDLHQLR